MQHNSSDIAAICSDPNALVALVNATPSVWVPVDRCAQTRFTHTLKPLVLQTADDFIRDVMDALAGLSPKQENTSVACGLRVDDRGTIEIIIASNNNVAETTQNHIRRVWKEMVVISALSRSPRAGDGLRGSQKARDLVRSLYEYCMPSFSVKFLETFTGLRDWVAGYHELHEREAAKPSPFWRLRMDELRLIVKRIENILKDLAPYEQAVSMSFTSPNEPTLDMFIPIVESVMEEVNSLLAIGQSTNPYIETWNPLLILGGWVNNLCRKCTIHLFGPYGLAMRLRLRYFSFYNRIFTFPLGPIAAIANSGAL
ncbi:hypothetical protein GALMADRAFT_159116 [Galerina marginata CBS 339.88]|uniref:Uncharacterized protein n=1 Tax=Galerina marginata (strain CBS 339.88) TaxID=685588 RepID=A0A067SZ69_GALM3|nr:hypothetical protein GALMADRAFT_159116 [Galerina marginata CBS 339.88]